MARVPIPPPPARRRAAVAADGDYGVSDRPDWREIDWAAHLRTMEIGGVPVNYVDIGDQGDRRPIVFVHGLSGQWQNWLENIPRFAEQRRVVALDLPGFGMTPMPQEKITIELYGRVVAELCDRLGLAPAVLVGNSMGGYVAAQATIEAPEAVERLMLVAAAGISQGELPLGTALRAGKIFGLATRASTAQRRHHMARPALRHWILSLIVRHPTRLRPDIAFEGLVKGAGKAGFVDALEACIDYDFRDRLPEIACPTLVVWGREDAIIPVGDADTYVELIPRSRKLIFEDTGHVAMVERPIAFNKELQSFLDYEVSPEELEQPRSAAAIAGDSTV
jgi:pimeloyl-ACP methyl ester carboxylesterase